MAKANSKKTTSQIDKLKKRLVNFKNKFKRHESVCLKIICREIQIKLNILQYKKSKDELLEKCETNITNIDGICILSDELELSMYDIKYPSQSLCQNNSKLAKKIKFRKMAVIRMHNIMNNCKKLSIKNVSQKSQNNYICNATEFYTKIL